LKVVGYFDCAGGGQAVVATTSPMSDTPLPNGTSIIDVSIRQNSRLAQIKVRRNAVHKVRRERCHAGQPRGLPIGRVDLISRAA
jgi:hypothetical protein